MKTSLLLKLLQKINNVEFLKQELENLFGKEAIPSIFTNFTDEQFKDLLKSKSSREILYKIYMYVKGDKLPQDLKKLVDDKIEQDRKFIYTACDMLYMFNNEELLKREDIKQIFELIIDLPQSEREYIINAFKEVDLSKTDNVREFIDIILEAEWYTQAECASKAYIAIMKEINHHEKWNIYNTDSFYDKAHRELYDRNKKNVIPITRIIANCKFCDAVEYVYNFVVEKSKDTTSGIMFWHSYVAAWPEILEVIEELLSATGIEQAKILEETYRKMVDKLYDYREHPFKYPGQMEPIIKSNLLGVIGKALGPVQAQAVADYILSITDFQDEAAILVNATAIANWKNANQIPNLVAWFGYDTDLWEKYASKITFWEDENKKNVFIEISELHRKHIQFDLDKMVEILSNAEENSFLILNSNIIGYISYIFIECGSKYFLRYIEALLKIKDKLTYYLLMGYMMGFHYKKDSSGFKFVLDYVFRYENQVSTILNIIEETGIGFINDFDDEESIKMVERLVNSQQPIEVTLKELMKLPPDVVEKALENAPEEIDADGKVFIIRPQINQINED